MSEKEIECTECDAIFEVVHDTISEPEYCPFCGNKLRYSTEQDDGWYEEEDEG